MVFIVVVIVVVDVVIVVIVVLIVVVIVGFVVIVVVILIVSPQACQKRSKDYSCARLHRSAAAGCSAAAALLGVRIEEGCPAAVLLSPLEAQRAQ